MCVETPPGNTHGVGSSTQVKTEGLISQKLRRKTNHKRSLTNGWKQPQEFSANMRNLMHQLPQKMEDSLIIPCFQWKENLQCTNSALGKTWPMQLLLKKRQQQRWHVFILVQLLCTYHFILSMCICMFWILKWDFSSIKHAKRLFLAGSVALVMLVNSHLCVPDGHNRKFSFPKPRNFSVVQTVAESSILKTIKLWFT